MQAVACTSVNRLTWHHSKSILQTWPVLAADAMCIAKLLNLATAHRVQLPLGEAEVPPVHSSCGEQRAEQHILVPRSFSSDLQVRPAHLLSSHGTVGCNSLTPLTRCQSCSPDRQLLTPAMPACSEGARSTYSTASCL